MYRSVLLIVLSFLCVGNDAIHSLFPIDIGLMEEDSFLPLERDTFDDCHLRYMRYGRDDWTIRDVFRSYNESRDYSHIAAIGWIREGGTTDWTCMGALIWDSVVLTSAHCTIGEGNSAPNVVRLGGPSYVQQRRIKAIIRHPNFTASDGLNDIALIQLDGRITINETVVPTCLWLSEEVPFSNLDSLLRTTADSDEPYATEEMNRLHTQSQECFSLTAQKKRLPETQLCMKTLESDVACNESPEGNLLQVRLQHNYKTSPVLVGIQSSSLASGTCNPVRGYTKIANYRDWIIQVLHQQNVTVPPQAFFPAVCAHRFAHLRPRVEYLMYERFGDIPSNYVQVESTNERDLSYIVQFEWPSEATNVTQHDCVGTFVDQQTILTLASCVDPATSNGYQPTAAIHVMSYRNRSYPIKSITIHPNYVKGSHKNNIAVVKLETRQEVVPACIWRHNYIPDDRVDLTGIGISGLNFYEDDSYYDPKHGDNTIVQHAMDKYPFENCSTDLVELIGNRSLAGLNEGEHLCFHSNRWLVPGVCRDIVGGPVLRYINRGAAYFKYLFALTVGGRTCGHGQPTIAIHLAPHYAWLQSVIFGKRGSGVAEPSESLIVINPDLKRSDECSNGDGTMGICVPYELCLSTKERLRKGDRITLCSDGSVVCCPWGDIAKNSAVDPVRTELENCEDRYHALRRDRFQRTIHNESLYTNQQHVAEIGWPQNNGRIVFECVGFLITPNIIVSSARCMETYPHKPTVARIGALVASDASNYVIQPIRRVRMHEDYDPLTGVNNIALVALTAPIEINVFHFPGCLYRNNTHLPVRQFAINENRGTIVFQKVSPLYKSDCAERHTEKLAPGQMCLLKSVPEGHRPREVCLKTGDVIAWENRTEVMDIFDAVYLVGLFSHGACEMKRVQIATRVSFYFDWIVLNAK